MISFILSVLSIIGCTILSMSLSVLTSYFIINHLEDGMHHETGVATIFIGGFIFSFISLIVWNVIIFKLFLL